MGGQRGTTSARLSSLPPMAVSAAGDLRLTPRTSGTLDFDGTAATVLSPSFRSQPTKSVAHSVWSTRQSPTPDEPFLPRLSLVLRPTTSPACSSSTARLSWASFPSRPRWPSVGLGVCGHGSEQAPEVLTLRRTLGVIAILEYPLAEARCWLGKRDSPGGIAFLSVFWGCRLAPVVPCFAPDERRRADPPFRPGHRRRSGSGSHLAIDSTRLELGVIRSWRGAQRIAGRSGSSGPPVPLRTPRAAAATLRFKRGDAGSGFCASTRASPRHPCLTIPSVSLPAHSARIDALRRQPGQHKPAL